MLNENQEQSVSGGSLAIQAKGDVIVYSGLSITDVRELCTLFLRDNFPKLREEAAQTAMERVQRFAEQLEQTLTANIDSLVADRFREPEVQATINEAVQAAAKKGEDSNPNILVHLIQRKLSSNCSHFADVVFSEAVKLTPLLTREQIAFLAFVLFIQTFYYPSATLNDLEAHAQTAWAYSEIGFGLSDAQREYIDYTGAATVYGNFAVRATPNIHAEMAARYRSHQSERFGSVTIPQIPTLAKLLSEYEKNKGSSVELTTVGKAIALSYISLHVGPIDFSPWIH